MSFLAGCTRRQQAHGGHWHAVLCRPGGQLCRRPASQRSNWGQPSRPELEAWGNRTKGRTFRGTPTARGTLPSGVEPGPFIFWWLQRLTKSGVRSRSRSSTQKPGAGILRCVLAWNSPVCFLRNASYLQGPHGQCLIPAGATWAAVCKWHAAASGTPPAAACYAGQMS